MRRIMVMFLIFIVTSIHAETLTIGIPSFSPPFVMTADNKNHYIGFSIDIMAQICKKLGVSCRFQSFLFDETFSQVIDHRVDLAIGSFTITPQREEKVLFSLPYLQSDAAIVTTDTNDIQTIDDLKGKTIGAERDSVFVSYIQQQYGDKITVIPYDTIPELMFALSEGNIDATIFDKETAYFWLGNNYDMFKLVGTPFPLGQGIGIMANQDNQALINRVNQILIQMETEGTYLKIYNTYFGDMKAISSGSLFNT